jgi:RHS repeat-associated protein
MRKLFNSLVERVSRGRTSKTKGKREQLSRQIGFESLEARQVMTAGIFVIAEAYQDYPTSAEYAVEPLDQYEEDIDGHFAFFCDGSSFSFTIGGDAELGVDYRFDYNTAYEPFISKDGNVWTVSEGYPYTDEMGFDIIVLDDATFEGVEAVTVTINPGSFDPEEYHINQGTASIHIVDFEDLEVEESDPFDIITDPPTTCETCTANPNDPANGSSGSLNPKSNTVGGVSAIDGSVRATTDYASSNAFGTDLGISLSWSNSAATLTSSYGQGMTNSYESRLAVSGNDDVLVSIGSTKSFFYKDGSEYLPYHSDASSLTFDSGNHTYTYGNTTGTSFTYYDDASDIVGLLGFPELATERLRGQLLSMTDAFGNITTYHYDINLSNPAASTGLLLSIERTDGVTTESWEYSYLTSGENEGLVSEIIYRIDAADVRTLQFDYYTNTVDTTSFEITAIKGHLKSVTVRDGGSSDEIIDQTFYRYYGHDDADGYLGGLKMLLRTGAIERATNALSLSFANLIQASDEELADYADLNFKYDDQKRVTELVALGEGCTVCSASGEGKYEYSYDVSSNSDNYNSWKRKTVETLPDGTERIYFLNYAGQKMLDITKVGSDEWITYYKYDSQGRMILQANPSAMLGYDEAYESLIDNDGGNLEFLADNAGLITTYSYATSTTATATTSGAATGYLSGMAIQQGESGTSIPQTAIQYYAHESEVDGTFVYPVATQTVYRNDNGTGGQTTTYTYTWREDGSDETNQILSTTITSAFVSSSQNGSNTTESSITVNDEYGRPVWMKDAAGFLSYIEYDDATGAVVKMIRDVDTSETADFANKPSGWTTPGGGGLHLTTAYEVDALGRTIKMVDPKGNITYTVYNDAAHEVRTYRGWDAVNNLPTGPVELSRGELTGTYTHDSTTYYGTFTEYLTYSVVGHSGDGLEVDGSGRPLGNEQINDSDSGTGFNYTTTLQTLSRSLSNAGGQLIKSDQYYDFTGTTYTTSTFELTGADADNFNRTEFGYDKRGRQNRVLDAEGLITRTVYDALGRVSSTWIGTDDMPTSGLFAPDNLTGTNMVQLSEYEYDHGGVGDGNLTRSIQIPGGGLDDRVTDYLYDWRNRTVAVKAGEESTTEDTDLNRAISYTEYDNLNHAIAQYVYDGDDVTITVTSGVPNKPSSSLLRAKSTADYDDQGRVYKTTQLEVDQTDGTIGSETIVNETFRDIRGLVTKTVDPNGNETTFDYDSLGRQVIVTTEDPDGVGSLTGIVSYTVYDANGNVVWSILNPTDYDLGDLDDNAFGTYYTYDALDRRVSIEQPDPDNFVPFGGSNGGAARPETTFTYDAAGWLYEVTDPLNRVTRTEYDRLGRTVKTTLPDPATGTITGSSPIYRTSYNGVGNVLTTTDALNNVTTYGYNDYHQRVSTTLPDPDGVGGLSAPVSYASYTPGGDLLTSTDTMGRVTTYEYDLLGRQFQITSPDPDGVGGVAAARMTYTFDVLGAVLTITDRLGHQTESAYDGFHRLSVSANANDEETSFTYDANGNRLTLTDPNGNTTEWDYDAVNRVIAETNELNNTRTYEYDQAGRLIVTIDRLAREVESVYDNLNRKLEEKWEGVTQYEWTYDAVGQMLSATSVDVLSNDYYYTYDKLGRLTQRINERYDAFYPSKRLYNYYGYNLVGSRTSTYTAISWDLGYSVTGIRWDTKTLDNLQRVTQELLGGNDYRYQKVTYSYNDANQLSTIDRFDYTNFYDPDGSDSLLVHTEYGYDESGRLNSLVHLDPDDNPFASYGYTWDAADRITAVDFLDGTYDDEDVTYAYDDAGQVTGADRDGTGAVLDESYDYDANGNRESVTRDGVTKAWDATTNNQLSTDGIHNYVYDDEGNLSAKIKLDAFGVETDERTEYSWDHRNRLIGVTMYNSSNVLTKTVEFTYDASDFLVFRSVTTNTVENTEYLWDGNQLFLAGYILVYGPGTDLVLFTIADKIYSLLGDHLNTVRDMVTRDATSGDPVNVNHITYDSFGRKISESDTTGNVVFLIGFTGRYYEHHTGLQNNWYRWYDPTIGRWISEDPIGFAAGDPHLHRYVGNQSVISVDPNGLETYGGDWHTDIETKTYENEVDRIDFEYYQSKATDIKGKMYLDAGLNENAKAMNRFIHLDFIGVAGNFSDEKKGQAAKDGKGQRMWLTASRAVRATVFHDGMSKPGFSQLFLGAKHSDWELSLMSSTSENLDHLTGVLGSSISQGISNLKVYSNLLRLGGDKTLTVNLRVDSTIAIVGVCNDEILSTPLSQIQFSLTMVLEIDLQQSKAVSANVRYGISDSTSDFKSINNWKQYTVSDKLGKPLTWVNDFSKNNM